MKTTIRNVTSNHQRVANIFRRLISLIIGLSLRPSQILLHILVLCEAVLPSLEVIFNFQLRIQEVKGPCPRSCNNQVKKDSRRCPVFVNFVSPHAPLSF